MWRKTCALLSDTTVICWGDNTKGQLGMGSEVSQPLPGERVVGLEGVVALAVGNDHVCALLDDGEVRCWGDNDKGKLGDGTGVDSSLPVQVDIEGVLAIDSEGSHTCALLESGKIACWGWNASGQLGSGDLPPTLGEGEMLGPRHRRPAR